MREGYDVSCWPTRSISPFPAVAPVIFSGWWFGVGTALAPTALSQPRFDTLKSLECPGRCPSQPYLK
jgi:hypothetical protein